MGEGAIKVFFSKIVGTGIAQVDLYGRGLGLYVLQTGSLKFFDKRIGISCGGMIRQGIGRCF